MFILMLLLACAKVVDGKSGPESAAEAAHTVVDGKHLVLILAPKDGHLLQVANMQEYFSFLCGSWWWF
jgi:hypothetical protein